MIIIKIRKKFAKKIFAPGLVHGVMQEKVYNVLGTPPQYLAGVYKNNNKLTSVLKKKHQHTKSFKLKRRK